MCLIVVRHRTHPRYPLIIAANRDEYYARPTRGAAFWDDAPGVLAGRDELGGGTWFGVTRSGRWAAVTNVRSPERSPEAARSRGALTADFLRGTTPVAAYAEDIAARATSFHGFNLLVGDGETLAFVSGEGARVLADGDYALSNATLDTPWPKARALRGRLADDAIADDESALLDALYDRAEAPDDALPDTGVGVALERFLSPIFIAGVPYGTRSSTVFRVDTEGHARFVERTFGPEGAPVDEHGFVFDIAAR